MNQLFLLSTVMSCYSKIDSDGKSNLSFIHVYKYSSLERVSMSKNIVCTLTVPKILKNCVSFKNLGQT